MSAGASTPNLDGQIILSPEERDALEDLARQSGYDGSISGRVRIVLSRADGRTISDIAKMFEISRGTAYRWIDRYQRFGLNGLLDRPRSGRPTAVSRSTRARIQELSAQPPPLSTGLAEWTASTLARYLQQVDGVDILPPAIYRVWEADKHKQPESLRGGLAHADVQLVGLYLDPPAGAAALTIDDVAWTSAAALPVLPFGFRKYERRDQKYVKHASTSLFREIRKMAMSGAEQRIRENSGAFLTFVSGLRAMPGEGVRLVLDDPFLHILGMAEADIRGPGISCHATPRQRSWLCQLEVWFGVITSAAVQRHDVGGYRNLIGTVNDYLAGWCPGGQPLSWSVPRDGKAIMLRVPRDGLDRLTDNGVCTAHRCP